MRFYNVTIHISLLAESEEEAGARAVGLIDYSEEDVNVSVHDDETEACDDDEEEIERS